MITIADKALLDKLSDEARHSPRLRKNFNFHKTYDDSLQRLLNAMEPGTYVRPHRHLHPPKREAFWLVRGELLVIFFNDDGSISDKVLLSHQSGNFGVDIEAGVWHTILSLKQGSVAYEVKDGPYNPLNDKDFADWAPAEGSPLVENYLRKLLG